MHTEKYILSIFIYIYTEPIAKMFFLFIAIIISRYYRSTKILREATADNSK